MLGFQNIAKRADGKKDKREAAHTHALESGSRFGTDLGAGSSDKDRVLTRGKAATGPETGGRFGVAGEVNAATEIAVAIEAEEARFDR